MATRRYFHEASATLFVTNGTIAQILQVPKGATLVNDPQRAGVYGLTVEIHQQLDTLKLRRSHAGGIGLFFSIEDTTAFTGAHYVSDRGNEDLRSVFKIVDIVRNEEFELNFRNITTDEAYQRAMQAIEFYGDGIPFDSCPTTTASTEVPEPLSVYASI